MGCGDDGEPAADPTTTVSATSSSTASTASSSTSTTASSTTSTLDAAAADGISSPEDAAVFVLTAWIDGDREAASRHADDDVVDVLFSFDPPDAAELELATCDSADLERFDCFLVAAGTIYVVGVEDLRVVEIGLGGGGAPHDHDEDPDHEDGGAEPEAEPAT